MAEKTRGKIRCIGIDLSDVIVSAAGIAAAVWVKQPLALRDDALTVVPGDVTEDEVYSHENDIAEDYDAIGTGSTASGSFMMLTPDELKELVGGVVQGVGENAIFLKSGKINILEKAIRFRLKDGGAIIIPRARGYVDIDLNLGATDGRFKCPFVFKALAQADFDCGLAWQVKIPVENGGGE